MKWGRSHGGIIVFSILTLTQYILAFFVFRLPGWMPLQWIGGGIWVVSLYFAFAPIFILRKRGGVSRGESYVKTTRLVNTGLFAIVRHPQYLSGIMFNVAMMLLAQHWLVFLLGFISAVLMYIDIQGADQEGIEKFGEEYRQYMRRVPQMNFILGIIRLIQATP